MTKVAISSGALSSMLKMAKTAGRQECMGLLVSPGACDHVTAAVLLPASASPASAETEPAALKEYAERLRSAGFKLRGIWHSHGAFSVFHSSTDNATIRRLLPALAPENCVRVQPATIVPAVTGSDTAILPLNNGLHLTFLLEGSAVPGMDARLRATWAKVETDFCDPESPPGVRSDGISLWLEAGGVRLRLGIPENSSVTQSVVDRAPFRIARLYSVVVNARGDRCAECLLVRDIDGQFLLEQTTGEIVEVTESSLNSLHFPALPIGAGMPGESRLAFNSGSPSMCI